LQHASQEHSTDESWTGLQEPDVENRFVISSVTYAAKKEAFQLP